MGHRENDAWIETTHDAHDQRTCWRIVIDGEVVCEGSVEDDVTGATAYERAQAWVGARGLTIAGWKHALAHTELMIARPRTRSDQRAPLQFSGWLCCASGGREPVVVSAAQLRALEERSLRCPVCDEACAPQLEPATVSTEHALVWTGTRWHSH